MKNRLVKLLPFLIWFKAINKNTIKEDIIAGFTGAVVVLPQGVAFATIAGLPPEYGLYTAMVTPIIAALFGSSYHLVSGPTTAISIVMFSTISKHVDPGSTEFISMALTLTFLAGVYQLAFGLARFGTLVNFVSHTVVTGFTFGAAILIATSQLKHITGIYVPKGESFLQTWVDLYQGSANFDVYFLLIALVTLFSSTLFKRFLPKSPNLLIGMILGSVLAFYLSKFQLSTNIEFVGKIPAHLPPLSMPYFSLSIISELASEAFAIALLGLIEAISISKAIATKSNQRINSNQEFIGQGMSNIFASFFSSYAGSGSFTRSGINYESGAKTPLSAIFAALFLMIIVLLIAPLTAYLPISVMGGVILLVAYNLIDIQHIIKIFKYSKSESSILITTFLATIFLELEFAIYLGVLLSLVLFLAKTSTPRIPTLSIDSVDNKGHRNFTNISKKPLRQCLQLKIIRVDMSIYFGSINHIQKKIEKISDGQNIYNILIVASGINFIDLSGIETLASEQNRLKRKGGGLYFVGLKAPVYQFLAQTHFIEKIGRINFFDSKEIAISAIYKRLNRDICSQCDAKIFNECNS